LTAARGDLNSVLKDDSHTTIGRESRWSLRNGLVVGQMAFSLLLLLGAGLCLRSFDKLQKVDPGFDARHLVSVPINLDEVGNAPSNSSQVYRELLDRLAVLPGVRSVTHSWSAPFAPGGQLGLEPQMIEGHTPRPGERLPLAAELVGPDYFETLGVSFVETPREELAGRRQLLFVNEAFARKYWPGQSAIGKRVANHTVAGVVANSRFAEVWREPAPTTYLQVAEPFNHTRCNLLVRAEGDPQAIAALLRQEIRRFNPSLSTSGIRTAQAAWEESLAPQRFTLALLGVFASVALFLAAIGIHGVMSFVVSQRTREIGIRMALGAQRREVLALVVGQGMGLALTGTLVGLAAGLGFTRLISGLLFQVEPTDPLTFSIVAGLLLITALGACLRPARQAANTDPMIALRAE
jgi:predicted permease